MTETMRAKLGRALRATPLHRMYDRLRWRLGFRDRIRQFRDWSGEDERRLSFYRSFVRPGDLVFDVGANLGNRTRVFLKLQARVVAFEPRRECHEFLVAALGDDPRVRLVRKALGGAPGVSEMFVGSAHTVSSLSPGWIASVTRSARFAGDLWRSKVAVEVSTLDAMIAAFGVPAFAKIDVEGFEYEVVSGLSRPLDCLSLEFTPEYLDNTFRSIDHLAGLSPIELNYALEETMALSSPRWLTPGEMKDTLKGLDPRVFGDVYVRTRR